LFPMRGSSFSVQVIQVELQPSVNRSSKGAASKQGPWANNYPGWIISISLMDRHHPGSGQTRNVRAGSFAVQ
jgi:hypothetical protein